MVLQPDTEIKQQLIFFAILSSKCNVSRKCQRLLYCICGKTSVHHYGKCFWIILNLHDTLHQPLHAQDLPPRIFTLSFVRGGSLFSEQVAVLLLCHIEK